MFIISERLYGFDRSCFFGTPQGAGNVPPRDSKPIQLLCYPPYHSKYNPIERCWGILEQHWNGAKLINVETMMKWAQSMTWKGMYPVINFRTPRKIGLIENIFALIENGQRRYDGFRRCNP